MLLFYYFTKSFTCCNFFYPVLLHSISSKQSSEPHRCLSIFGEFLQTSFALPLLYFSCPCFWGIFVFRMFLPFLRMCLSFIVGVLRFGY